MNFLRRYSFSTINSTSKEIIEKEFMKLDFYSILQVKHSATTNEIRKNYFELAKIFHPDKYKGPSTIFKKLSESYNTLKDPIKREDYDKKIKIKQNVKYRAYKSKQKSKANTDFYEGMKSKYEEDFKQINIERLFGQFITSPIKNPPKNFRVKTN
jgi:DnaJ-class molecular chaperone